jgi:hypothetical protein
VSAGWASPSSRGLWSGDARRLTWFGWAVWQEGNKEAAAAARAAAKAAAAAAAAANPTMRMRFDGRVVPLRGDAALPLDHDAAAVGR